MHCNGSLDESYPTPCPSVTKFRKAALETTSWGCRTNLCVLATAPIGVFNCWHRWSALVKKRWTTWRWTWWPTWRWTCRWTWWSVRWQTWRWTWCPTWRWTWWPTWRWIICWAFLYDIFCISQCFLVRGRGSGSRVGVRAGGLEVGAQRAPRLLVCNIVINREDLPHPRLRNIWTAPYCSRKAAYR